MAVTLRTERRAPLTAAVVLVMVLAPITGCTQDPTPDPDALSRRAVTLFQDCFSRNHVQTENVEVEVSATGHVRTLSVQVVGEGDVPFEPQVRLACTEEVEARLAA